MGVANEIKRIINNISNAYDILFQHGAKLPDLKNSDNLVETINSIDFKANSLDEFEEKCDEIYGSEEEFLVQKNNIILLSKTCDAIIGKDNTSSVYSEIEFDTLDKLSLKADEIIGE